MGDATFKAAFAEAQQKIRGMSVAFIAIPNDLELYLFEVYAAMELGTAKYNSFRTH